MSKVLVCGDLHLPWSRIGYLQFCRDLYKKHKCNKVVFIGDVIDCHAISFHQKEPGCPGPLEEYRQTKEEVHKWYKAFPKATVVLGNHDKRIVRRAKSVDIPDIFLKSYSDIWETQGWNWVDDIVIDDCYYYHGDGQSGEYPAANAVRKMLMSVVMGHNHTASGVKFYTNPTRRIFAMDVGAGCDDRAMAFAYAERNKRRSVLSAGVVIDGIPYVEPMPCSHGEKYHKSRFEK